MRKPANIKTAIVAFMRTPEFLALAIFMVFLAANWSLYGPAYLSDEVGYLNKAATIAGKTVQVSSAWFGGYSIMISQAYFLSDDPFVSWKIILILNAAMWATSALLLRYVLIRLHPTRSANAVAVATAVAMTYPAWLSMSGYAFATSGFVLVFMASIACLVRSNLQNYKWLCFAALLAGYLFWIHPLGGVYTALFAAYILFAAIATKQPKLIFVPILTVIVAAAYSGLISPLFNTLMLADGSAHYDGTLTNIFDTIQTGQYWVRFGLLTLGIVFSLLIATFGTVAFGVHDSLKAWFKNRRLWRTAVTDSRIYLPVLLAGVTMGVICVNAASTASNLTPIRLDEWVYGRYAEMTLLPLIGIGLLAPWSKRVLVACATFILAVGVLLSLYTNPQNTMLDLNNKVNIQSLWPMHLTSILHIREYALWGLLGALSLIIIYVAIRRNQKSIAFVLAPVLIATQAANLIYHHKILVEHSTVTSLYSYVTSHYNPDDCIGFTPEKNGLERFNLYSYYLHGYDVRAMSLESWREEECSGPYFTYSYPPYSISDIHVAGVERSTGLHMLICQSTAPNSVIVFD